MPPAAPVTSTTFMAPQGVRTACPWLRDWRGVLRPWCSNRYENRVCMPACPEAGNPAATALLRTHPRRLPILGRRVTRSEEHTSELQSLMRISYAVFCLKKKKKNQPNEHVEYRKLRRHSKPEPRVWHTNK